MRSLKITTCCLFFLSLFCSSVFPEETSYNNILELYNHGLYSIAHEKFNDLINNSNKLDIIEKAYYYIALSSFQQEHFNLAISEFSFLLINFPNSLYTKEAKYYIACSYFLGQNYIYAIKNFKGYLQLYPEEKDNYEIQLLFGKSYFYLGHYDKAYEYFTSFQNRKEVPKKINQEISFFLGQIYYLDKKYDKALLIFNEIIKNSQDDPVRQQTALFYTGLINYLQNDEVLALQNLGSALKLKNNISPLKEYNSLFYHLIDRSLNKKLLADILTSVQDIKLRSFIRLVYIEKSFIDHDYDKIENILLEESETAAVKDIYYHYLYQYYFIKDDMDEAERYTKKLIQDYPDSLYFSEAVYNLSMLYYQKKDYQTAKLTIQPLNGNNTLNTDLSQKVLFLSGRISYYLKEYDTAENTFAKLYSLINKNGNTDEIISFLLNIALIKDDPQRALKLLPLLQNPDPYFRLKTAEKFFEQGNFKQASPLLENIFLQNNDAQSQYRSFQMLKEIYIKTGNIDALNEGLVSVKNNKYFDNKQLIDILINIAVIQFKNKNYKGAADTLLSARTFQPEQAQKTAINYQLYQIYFNSRQPVKAMEVLRSLLESDPENTEYLKWETELNSIMTNGDQNE